MAAVVAAALERVLAGPQVRLVLDNCEHVIGAAAKSCGGLLAAWDVLAHDHGLAAARSR